MKMGDIYKTKNSGDLVVLAYSSHCNVDIEFIDTGFKATVTADNIRRGLVKDKMRPIKYGLGFIGCGDHKSSDRYGKHTKAYACWTAIFQRCYEINRSYNNIRYEDCFVSKEWHNFQNFAEWYAKNYPKDSGDYQIDKDILVDGNRIYSPNFCKFVTRQENCEKAKAKNFIFINPDGETVKIYNLSKFCSKNSLSQSAMSMVSSGLRKHHKKWKSG